MRKLVSISFFLLLALSPVAQVVFQTLLKKGPVAVGESFQVQFVLEDIGRDMEVYPPDFKDFRVIRGPVVHKGVVEGPDGPRKMKNYVYTLEATHPGRFRIHGASAKVDNFFFRSDDINIEVIQNGQALGEMARPDAVYFLQPGEDPYAKIAENIFFRVMVDRKTCFVGQPVTATFKLYSRLVSHSDIVKNPGFYGFSVQEMEGLRDNKTTIEKVGGKVFDVYTISKVQLYPLQAGFYSIDPMEVAAKVEFSRTVVDKKAEQEIDEGRFSHNIHHTGNTETYESTISSQPLSIAVKPIPVKNRPEDFAGATGHFSIHASVDKPKLGKNEEGQLTVSISGSGNFTQLTAPVIHWPDSMENFEPKISDSLDSHIAPLKGGRIFKFPFIASKPGKHSIPSINLSYFDPDSNSYRTVATGPLNIEVSQEETKPGASIQTGGTGNETGRGMIILTALLAMAAFASLFYLKRGKARSKESILPVTVIPTAADMLAPAYEASSEEPRLFYTTLRNCIWNFLGRQFGLKGSAMNRQQLLEAMDLQKIPGQDQAVVMELLLECETGVFADARIETDRRELLIKTGKILEAIANRNKMQ